MIDVRQEPGSTLPSSSGPFDPYALAVPLDIFVGTEDASRRFAAHLAANALTRVHRFPGGHHGFLADRVIDEVYVAIAAAWRPTPHPRPALRWLRVRAAPAAGKRHGPEERRQ